jgi:hypothetical protein
VIGGGPAHKAERCSCRNCERPLRAVRSPFAKTGDGDINGYRTRTWDTRPEPGQQRRSGTALAEFASLNNLAAGRDLPRVFNAVAPALAGRGWFRFDVNTPLSLRTEYPQTLWLEDKRVKLV